MSQEDPRPQGATRLESVLRWFFDTAEVPVVICDPVLQIVTANEAFGKRVGVRSLSALVGCPLAQHIEMTLPPVRDPGRPQEVIATLPGGAEAVATVRTVGEHVVVTLDAGLEGARLARLRRTLEDHERVFAVGRLLSLLMSEDDLVGVVAQALGDFFGDRSFCIRTVDGQTHALLSLYAKGTLKEEARTRLHLKESAVRKLRLGRRIRESPHVVIGSEHVRVFEDTEVGIGVPLVAGGQLLGHIALEGPAGAFENIEADERLTIALANQLAVALRNVRLLAEARYLRGYLEKVIEQAGALVLAVDRQGKITIFNRACQQLSGFSRTEAQGIALLELFVPEERDRLASLLKEALKGYSAENVELTVLRRDGERHPIAVNAAPILGKDGIVESVVLIGHDLSRLLELERQVVRAEKLATLGQLATAVVHELNNPLTSIVAYADALRARLSLIGTEADEARAGKIIEATERILRFTRDLLTYARPGTETTSRLDLQEVIDESLRLCQHTVEQAGVQVSVSWDPAIPWIVGHRSRLQQVFVNLVTNACQAMRPNGGTLEIVGRVREEMVEVRLVDSGPGLAPEIAERIFEPFFSTKAPGQGTGLGLSIVKEIVTRHSGSIEVESSPGEGATFVLRLPV